LPPPHHHASQPISPELALIDRHLAKLLRAERRDEAATPVPFLENDARDAMLRMCELSDVNPPQARRLTLAIAVPAVLWAEVLLLVASLVPFGAL
jgi:hypothetical protein